MSKQTAENIIESANSISRPLELPNVTIGFMGDLIINIIKIKADSIKKSRTLASRTNPIKS